MRVTTTNYYYEVVQAIAPSSYEITKTGDTGPGYSFQFEEKRDDVERWIREYVDRSPFELEELSLKPGYIKARLDPGDSSNPARHMQPKAVSPGPVREGIDAFNRNETRGDPALDGLHLGDSYLGIVPDPDAPTPEEFIEAECAADTPLDREGDGPIATLTGEADREAGTVALGIVGVWPISTESYAPEAVPTISGDDEEARFRWEEPAVDLLREHVERFAWRGSTYRLEIHPTYLRVALRSTSLTTPPAVAVFGDHGLGDVIRRSNRHRRELDIDVPEPILRPPLEMLDRVYVGADDAEAWIEANGLTEESGEPRRPPDPDPEPVGDGDGERSDGLLSRLGGGGP